MPEITETLRQKGSKIKFTALAAPEWHAMQSARAAELHLTVSGMRENVEDS